MTKIDNDSEKFEKFGIGKNFEKIDCMKFMDTVSKVDFVNGIPTWKEFIRIQG